MPSFIAAFCALGCGLMAGYGIGVERERAKRPAQQQPDAEAGTCRHDREHLEQWEMEMQEGRER